MKSIISLDTSSDQDDKIRQILEAELTAVKGVDELINDYILWMEAEQNILKNADHSARNFIQKTKGRIEVISQILEDLKQTPVASDKPLKSIQEIISFIEEQARTPDGWNSKCKVIPISVIGCMLVKDYPQEEIGQPTEEIIKNSQQKEVEKEEK